MGRSPSDVSETASGRSWDLKGGSCLLQSALTAIVLYAMAWFLGPNVDLYLPPQDPCSKGLSKVRQARTVADLRNTGAALLIWRSETASAMGAGSDNHTVADRAGTADRGLDLSDFRQVIHEEVSSLLHPSNLEFFMLDVPRVDGWGRAIEFYFLGSQEPPSRIAIRSPGCDGSFEGDLYDIGPFVATDYRRDVVWAEGEFVQWPGG